MDENSLAHYGVMGMKWGRKKSKSSKGSNVKTSKKFSFNNVNKALASQVYNSDGTIKKKALVVSGKDKLRNIAKTSAVVAGGVFTAAALGALGYTAYDQVVNSGQFRSVTTYGFAGVKDFDRDQVKVENNRGREISGPLDEDFLRRRSSNGSTITRSLRL